LDKENADCFEMKILVADDHPLFRTGIRHVLLQLGSEVQVDEVGDRGSLFALLQDNAQYALLLLDLTLPDSHGLTLIEPLSQQFPALPIVILSASESRSDMQRALDGGALGFIQKSATPGVLLSALRLVLAGGIYVPPALIQMPTSQTQCYRTSESKSDDLTPRQAAVLARVIEGKSNKTIAMELGLTEATVKAHITALFKVLRVSNRMQAAIAAGRINPLHS
jgi:DNA-binding NarL/FixJ family response regulator